MLRKYQELREMVDKQDYTGTLNPAHEAILQSIKITEDFYNYLETQLETISEDARYTFIQARTDLLNDINTLETTLKLQ